jgi:hypothetical protein
MGGGASFGALVSSPHSNQTSTVKPPKEIQMGQHVLEPGKSLSLHPDDRDEVQNNSHHEGEYIIAFNIPPLEVQHFLKSKHHVSFTVPTEGARIINNGKVELIVVSPH